MRLLVTNSKATLLSKSQDEDFSVVLYYCSYCGRPCAVEKTAGTDSWSEHKPGDSVVVVPNIQYTRVTFGIHPKIIAAQKRTPVRQSSAYFCRNCAYTFDIYRILDWAISRVIGKCPYPKGDKDAEYRVGEGCWITCQDFWGNERYLNFQTNLANFNNILLNLYNSRNNPFQIVDLESKPSQGCGCPVH